MNNSGLMQNGLSKYLLLAEIFWLFFVMVWHFNLLYLLQLIFEFFRVWVCFLVSCFLNLQTNLSALDLFLITARRKKKSILRKTIFFSSCTINIELSLLVLVLVYSRNCILCIFVHHPWWNVYFNFVTSFFRLFMVCFCFIVALLEDG